MKKELIRRLKEKRDILSDFAKGISAQGRRDYWDKEVTTLDECLKWLEEKVIYYTQEKADRLMDDFKTLSKRYPEDDIVKKIAQDFQEENSNFKV